MTTPDRLIAFVPLDGDKLTRLFFKPMPGLDFIGYTIYTLLGKNKAMPEQATFYILRITTDEDDEDYTTAEVVAYREDGGPVMRSARNQNIDPPRMVAV